MVRKRGFLDILANPMSGREHHHRLITAIINKAIRIKLDICEWEGPVYVLNSRNYEDLNEIRRLISELEELDSMAENNHASHEPTEPF